MSEQIEESLSALVDGEASDFEVRRLLREAGSGEQAEDLARQWSSYHLIGDAIRGEGAQLCAENFHLRVRSAIEGEEPLPADIPDVARAQDSREVPVAGHGVAWQRFAVAASVTVAVLVGVQQFGSQPAGEFQVAESVNRVSGAGLVAVSSEVSSSRQTQLPASVLDQRQAAEAQKRLNEFLLQHASHSSRQSGQGPLSFARLTSFDEE